MTGCELSHSEREAAACCLGRSRISQGRARLPWGQVSPSLLSSPETPCFCIIPQRERLRWTPPRPERLTSPTCFSALPAPVSLCVPVSLCALPASLPLLVLTHLSRLESLLPPGRLVSLSPLLWDLVDLVQDITLRTQEERETMEGRSPQPLPPPFDNQGNWDMPTMKILALYLHHYQKLLYPGPPTDFSSRHLFCPQCRVLRIQAPVNLCIARTMAPSIPSVLGSQAPINLYVPRATAPSDSFPFQFSVYLSVNWGKRCRAG